MIRRSITRLLTGASATALVTTAIAGGAPAHAITVPDLTYDDSWQVELHERELADVNGDGNADVVGFGYEGTYVALGRDDRTFTAPAKVLNEYGYDQGWRVDKHPRELADVNGDGHADVVGFGTAGTYVSYGLANGGFTGPHLAVRDFGTAQGWSTDEHQRVLGDVNGDGTDDLVGFGNAGTYVSYGRSDHSLTAPELKLGSFGADDGWTEDRYPRTLADVNGDGLQDIVGFGYAGTWVAYGEENNTLTGAALEVRDFGWAQSWRVDKHPRKLADVNGDGTADVVGFGNAGVYVSYGVPDAALTAPSLEVRDFGWDQGWRVEKHPRELARANSDATADIVGFGNAGTYVAYGQPDGTFTGASLRLRNFGWDQGWSVGVFPRELADVNGDGRAEVVGFGYFDPVVKML